jgi:hypothetical protein
MICVFSRIAFYKAVNLLFQYGTEEQRDLTSTRGRNDSAIAMNFNESLRYG